MDTNFNCDEPQQYTPVVALIELADNGYIVKLNNGETYSQEVFEIRDNYRDDNLAKCEAVKELLYSVMDAIGFYNSKHQRFRVDVFIENQELGLLDNE